MTVNGRWPKTEDYTKMEFHPKYKMIVNRKWTQMENYQFWKLTKYVRWQKKENTKMGYDQKEGWPVDEIIMENVQK